MNPKRTCARDRQRAAIHEAGQVIVARRMGFEISAPWIEPNDDGLPDETTWIGRVQIFRSGEKGEHARRMIGLAGPVAEWVWRGGWIEDFWPDTLSEDDWRHAGAAADQPATLMDAAVDVGALFTRGGSGWQALVAEARRLIIASRPSA